MYREDRKERRARRERYRGRGKESGWLMGKLGMGGGTGKGTASKMRKRGYDTWASMLDRRKCQMMAQTVSSALAVVWYLVISLGIYLFAYLEKPNTTTWIIVSIAFVVISLVWGICGFMIGFMYPWGPGGFWHFCLGVPFAVAFGVGAAYCVIPAFHLGQWYYGLVVITGGAALCIVLEIGIAVVTIGCYEPYAMFRGKIADTLIKDTPIGDLPDLIIPPGYEDAL